MNTEEIFELYSPALLGLIGVAISIHMYLKLGDIDPILFYALSLAAVSVSLIIITLQRGL